MPVSIVDLYAHKVRDGFLESDDGQHAVLRKLENLRAALREEAAARKPRRWFLGTSKPAAPPRGLYIWGSVGRGKTMLMDLFFESVRTQPKRRVHFHAFMAGVHASIHARRQELKTAGAKGEDPIAFVANAISCETRLLCFDEFNVTDITDAMILGRLFAALFARGTVIVATSNVEPANLYKDGLNRALFLPFIDLIQIRMEVVRLTSRTDFRLEKLSDRVVYHVPPNAKSAAALTSAFKALTGVERGAPATLEVLGRELTLPEAHGHVARCRFADLCGASLGPADFLTIARQFHTLILDAVPILASARRDEARRFITLIDTLYDAHVKLIASAEAEPADLYPSAEGRDAFEFKRTASRLVEMRSTEYLGLPHGSIDSAASGDASGLVET